LFGKERLFFFFSYLSSWNKANHAGLRSKNCFSLCLRVQRPGLLVLGSFWNLMCINLHISSASYLIQHTFMARPDLMTCSYFFKEKFLAESWDYLTFRLFTSKNFLVKWIWSCLFCLAS
jgi:hypothetical protein